MMNTTINQTRDWEDNYQQGDTPWKHAEPHQPVLQLFERIVDKDAKILEVGCGYGVEAKALATQGYQNILACDESATAIATAKTNGPDVNFQTLNFTQQHQQLGQYDIAYDIACAHTIKNAEGRRHFARLIHEHLVDDGLWINMTCDRDADLLVQAKTGVKIPGSLSFLELADMLQGQFIVKELVPLTIPVSRKGHPTVDFPAWLTVAQKLLG
tara:strand:+ start:116229 stop:116867 length:639 start_codon:yes stop_codon:yes gene_type:complete